MGLTPEQRRRLDSAMERHGLRNEQPEIIRVKLAVSPLPQLHGRLDLSPKEAEVLRYTAAGYRTAEIGAALIMAPETVRTHVRFLLRKLGARNRVQAVAIAYERGLFRPGSTV